MPLYLYKCPLLLVAEQPSWSCFPQVAVAGSPLCDTGHILPSPPDTGDTAHWPHWEQQHEQVRHQGRRVHQHHLHAHQGAALPRGHRHPHLHLRLQPQQQGRPLPPGILSLLHAGIHYIYTISHYIYTISTLYPQYIYTISTDTPTMQDYVSAANCYEQLSLLHPDEVRCYSVRHL